LAHVLDNPAWHAMTTNHRSISMGDECARRYLADVSPIAALADVADERGWLALGRLAANEVVGLVGVAPELLADGWTIHWHFPFVQMTCTVDTFRGSRNAADVLTLTKMDTRAMLQLVSAAKPGPMERRTVDMGRYVGIKSGGKLVSMAGERLAFPGYVEVASVCTDPAHSGNGFAEMVTTAITAGIVERGDTAFLHVRQDNHRAVSLYSRLGFAERCVTPIVAVSLSEKARAAKVTVGF